jgi:hypothetical protein
VTIVGKATPGSLVFSDTGLGDFSFTGPFFFADANGFFRVPKHLTNQLTNTEYLVVDPWGRQVIHAFPVLRVGP